MFRASGFGPRVSGFGLCLIGDDASGSWLRAGHELLVRSRLDQRSALNIWVSGFGFQVSGFGFRVPGFGFRVSGFGFQVLRVSRLGHSAEPGTP